MVQWECHGKRDGLINNWSSNEPSERILIYAHIGFMPDERYGAFMPSQHCAYIHRYQKHFSSPCRMLLFQVHQKKKKHWIVTSAAIKYTIERFYFTLLSERGGTGVVFCFLNLALYLLCVRPTTTLLLIFLSDCLFRLTPTKITEKMSCSFYTMC